MSQDRIGLIAGNGKFPLLFAKAAQKADLKVVAVGFYGETSPEVEAEVESLTMVHLGQLGKLLKAFKEAGIKKLCMCGGVTKTRVFKDVKPDLKAITLLAKNRHLSEDRMLRAFADFLEENGITVAPSHELLPEFMAEPGIYTRRRPSAEEKEDLRLAWEVATTLGKLGVGQTVAVRKKMVAALESMEGTNATILRAAELVGPGLVVLKCCKPNQDMRFDLPVIGLETMQALKEAKVAVMMVEADWTLIFDRAEIIRQADEAGICLMAGKAE